LNNQFFFSKIFYKGVSTKSKRGPKKSKVTVNKKVENEDISTVSTNPTQTNDEDIEKTENIVETKVCL